MSGPPDLAPAPERMSRPLWLWHARPYRWYSAKPRARLELEGQAGPVRLVFRPLLRCYRSCQPN